MVNRRLLILGAAVLVSVALVPVATALGNGSDDPPSTTSVQGLTALGNGFSYQGRLTDSGSPANGNYDLRFVLYDADVGGSQIGNTIAINSVAVTNGLFTVSLDFGSLTATATATPTGSPSPSPSPSTPVAGVWDGNSRWIELAVRTAGSSSYTVLNPRQAVSPAPYALYAKAAGGFALPYTASGSTAGTVGAVDITQSGGGITIAGRKPAASLDTVPSIYGLNGGLGAGVQGESTNASGIGVAGFASTGTGAKFSGATALELDGPIKVSGSRPSVFRHTVAVGTNTCAVTVNSLSAVSLTAIDNILTNGDPNAILIVTAVDATNTTLDLPVSGYGVVYDYSTGCASGAGRWSIYATSGAALVTGMKFDVLVIKQ